MDFDFSAEQTQLREELKRLLQRECGSAEVRAVLDGPACYDRRLWSSLAAMGLLGTAVPEEHGGIGLGYLELCVVAEELGRVLAPVPLGSTFLATELLLAAGSDAQKARWLPSLASGEAIGTLALAEGPGAIRPARLGCGFRDGMLSGVKLPVADGTIADVAVVSAQTEAGLSLALVELSAPGVTRDTVETIDPARDHARLTFAQAPAEPLGPPGGGWPLIAEVLDKAAVLTAFEQVGGAEAALMAARDQALDRVAFGRPIGSFQAIKHMLADMYVSLTLARANAYYAAWALSTDAPDLPAAAATARVSATRAYQHCARNGIQVHGGMGFTWEVDAHLHYRRSNLLALSIGSLSEWEDMLVDRLRAKAA